MEARNKAKMLSITSDISSSAENARKRKRNLPVPAVSLSRSSAIKKQNTAHVSADLSDDTSSEDGSASSSGDEISLPPEPKKATVSTPHRNNYPTVCSPLPHTSASQAPSPAFVTPSNRSVMPVVRRRSTESVGNDRPSRLIGEDEGKSINNNGEFI